MSVFTFAIFLSINVEGTLAASNDFAEKNLISEDPLKSEISLQSGDFEEPEKAVAQPIGGTGYILMGKQIGHTTTHYVTTSSFAIAFGSTETLLSKVFGLGGTIWNWLGGSYEPTSYAKIWAKLEVGNAYNATLKQKYNWFEDSQFNTYSTTTTRNKYINCSSYEPYCWES